MSVIFVFGVDASLTLAFMYTTSVNALLLFSLHVVWGALGGRVLLGDELPMKTGVMVLLGMGSAIATFLGDRQSGGEVIGTDMMMFGNIIAVAASVFFASLMIVYRFLAKATPGVSRLPASAAGSTLVAFLGLALSGGDVSLVDLGQSLPLFGLSGIVSGLAMLGYAVAAKDLTAAEMTLICMLEPLLGPIWVYVGVGQIPSLVSVIAGSIFMVGLVVHEALALAGGSTKDPSSVGDTTEDPPKEQSVV